VSLLDEFALIRALTENRQTEAFMRSCGVVTGIGDDAAVVRVTEGRQLVMSCDAMVEDVHFRTVTMRDVDIGYKLLASNISDMAAMGAVPKFALVTLCLPRQAPVERLEAIYSGLYECACKYGVAVVGGDTTSTFGSLTLSVSIIGEVEADRALLRSSARAGDIVFVTGTPGLSAAGLHYLLRQEREASMWEPFPAGVEPLVRAHCRPEPQVEAGRLLLASGVCGALNDISDGLASELWEIAEASGLGITLRQHLIPVDRNLLDYAMTVNADPWQWILYGGEDYALVGTVRAGHAERLKETFAQAGLAFHPIGEVDGGRHGVVMIAPDGAVSVLPKKGYNHFA
jgi:thiamine-monophosphate kinase